MKVTADYESGEVLLAIRMGGDIVGELASSGGGSRRLATVKVCSQKDSIGGVIEASVFAQLQQKHAELSAALVRTVALKLRSATRRRVDFVGSPPLVRLARVLVELVDRYGQPHGSGHVLVTVNITQAELGSLIGASEPTVHRAIRQMRQSGVIDAERGRRMIVVDLPQLRRTAKLLPVR